MKLTSNQPSGQDVNNQVHIQILILGVEVRSCSSGQHGADRMQMSPSVWLDQEGWLWKGTQGSAGTGSCVQGRLGSTVLHIEPRGSQGTSDTVV